MTEYTYLEVQFIFDPSSTWSHVSQFEGDLADFFAAYGMEAQTVKTIGGQPGKKLFLIRRIQAIPRLVNKPDPKSPQQKLNEMRQPSPTKQETRFKQGRFLKSKGYLVRK